MVMRFFNYIGSRRFAVNLLVITSSVIIFSNLLPRLDLMGQKEAEKLRKERPILFALSSKAGMRNLSKSAYFQAIPVFIFLSVTVCTIRRLRKELDRDEREPKLPDTPAGYSVAVPAGEPSLGKVEDFLLRKGWTVTVCDGFYYARKGDRGIWGSIVFHLGMDVILIGILVSVATGIDGRVILTEGFPMDMPKDARWGDNKVVADFPFSEMALESFTPVFQDGFPVLYESSILAVDRFGRLKRYTLGANRPLDFDGYKFIFTKAGYSPRFKMSKKGDIPIDAVANLLISMPGAIDFFDIQWSGIRVKVEMFPDYYEDGGVPGTRGSLPRNPVLFVELEKDGKIIGRGFLHKGKVVNFDDYTLEFVELRHWMEVIVSRDFGVPIIIAGFIFIAAGLGVRFILNERRLWIIIRRVEGGSMLELHGKARFFPALFEEEMKKTAQEMENL